ncbi:hypothetical protein GCM10025771_07700 [Niveibacterium umoris]|uniref:DUF4440 domain-containing protein n=1 Tax=Niveibacterium umoris TaxID=1193620 RepID=A0A840BM18_9RHOO|nr:nuclear transport factor 2 family protein [Niveibacterium umoris]MBB4013683.1 hypothetical protein [Niveibacterium umoris]
MTRDTCAGLVFGAIIACLMPHGAAHAAQDDALRETLDAYVEGWYAGDAARIETATHPDLIRRKPALAGTDGTIQLEEIDQLGLLAAARSGLGRRAPAEDRKRMATAVFAQRGIAALALVETGGTFSYLQLVRNGGRWQVLNVLWEPKASPDDGPTMQEAPQVEAAVRDYVDGWYSGDVARVRRALHPEHIRREPALLDAGGDIRITTRDAGAVAGAVRKGVTAGRSTTQAQTRIEVAEIRGRSAAVMLEAGARVEYLQMARNKGRWQIVTVLAAPIPD